jgi:hypothetical protein
MSERSGPLWDAVEGRAPLPRAAATLGLELIDADVGTASTSFGRSDPEGSSARGASFTETGAWRSSRPR